MCRSLPRAPTRFPGPAGGGGSRAPWHTGESSSGDGPQAGRVRARTTHIGSCSSLCSRETSLRRQCAGSSELSPRSQPPVRRAPRDPGVAEADRTPLPCSPQVPGSDPGPWRRKRTAIRGSNSVLPRDSRELKPASLSWATTPKLRAAEDNGLT